MESGIVYTETTVYSAPERYASEAPYQLAIIGMVDGSRRTVRIMPGHRVQIADKVIFSEEREGVAFYRRDG